MCNSDSFCGSTYCHHGDRQTCRRKDDYHMIRIEEALLGDIRYLLEAVCFALLFEKGHVQK